MFGAVAGSVGVVVLCALTAGIVICCCRRKKSSANLQPVAGDSSCFFVFVPLMFTEILNSYVGAKRYQREQTRSSDIDDGPCDRAKISAAIVRLHRQRGGVYDATPQERHFRIFGKRHPPCSRTGPNTQYNGTNDSSSSQLYCHQFSTLQRHRQIDGSLPLVPGKVKTAVSDWYVHIAYTKYTYSYMNVFDFAVMG